MSVEEINRDDEFHRELLSMNWKHGRGDVVAVVWDKSTNATLRHRLSGVIVCQLQAGLASFQFRVLAYPNNYTLFFRGKQKLVGSDYFARSTMP